MRYEIGEDYDQKQVLKYAIQKVGLSSSTIKKLKKLPQGIVLNGTRVTVRANLQAGDVLELNFEDKKEDENPNINGINIKLNIVYEDEAIIIIDKAPNMVTHPSYNHYEDSLANALKYYFEQKNRPFVFRAVNRLDRDTSGLVMIAKNSLYAHKLSDLMKRGNIAKKYIAILDGKIEGEGIISGYILREEGSIMRRKFSEAKVIGADYSETRYKVLYTGDNISLVEAEPITGRTHQLRVHFAEIGYAIVGDDMYGKPDEDIKRQALHAYSLEFEHPISGKIVHIFSSIPDDMHKIIERGGITCLEHIYMSGRDKIEKD